MDKLDRFFAMFDRVFDQLTWKAAFGEPQVHGDRTIIPVASIGIGFGMGGGEGQPACKETEETQEGQEAEKAEVPAMGGSGAGGGGGGWSRPLALIDVTPDHICVKPIIHWEKVILAWIAMAAWSSFWWAVVAREHTRRGGCD